MKTLDKAIGLRSLHLSVYQTLPTVLWLDGRELATLNTEIRDKAVTEYTERLMNSAAPSLIPHFDDKPDLTWGDSFMGMELRYCNGPMTVSPDSAEYPDVSMSYLTKLYREAKLSMVGHPPDHFPDCPHRESAMPLDACDCWGLLLFKAGYEQGRVNGGP